MEPLERARELFSEFEAQLRTEMPAGADVFDAHTHLGNDIDGMVGRYEELEAMLDRYGMSRCNVFCLDEPDRHPGFRAGNDRTLAFAERSAGKLIPFVRLDLSEDPIGEATRCLDLGARGIKLHPRAQKFLLNDERLSPIFELADDRDVLAGNADRIAAGEPPREPSAPKGMDIFSQPMSLARIHQYLSMATPLLWTRQPDRVGVLGLALNATHDRANGHREELDQIRELLLAAQDMWRILPEEGDEKDRMAHTRATFRLI